MRYKWLESHGYPIGSGHVESACKQIVCKRHRQAGKCLVLLPLTRVIVGTRVP